jgi:hypothetical protein
MLIVAHRSVSVRSRIPGWLRRLFLVACCMPWCPPSPGPRAGQTARPGNREGHTMTEAAVSFACNLTDHPEVRYTQSGIARAVFRVAVSGRREQEPSFFTVVAWRDQAEHATRSLAKAAGPWWSVGPSSAPGRRGTGAPGRSRSWPRSWAPACGGRPPRRPGRPGRAEPGGLPGHHRRLPPRQEPVINVTSRRCPRSPTDRFTAPGVSATIPLSSHPTIIRLGRQVRRQEALRWISATRSSSSLRWSPASLF